MVNGSEGFLRAIELCDLKSGGKYAAAAIVEFPGCRSAFTLDGLPPGHYPIYPDSVSLDIPVIIDGKEQLLPVHRYQLPIQLGFSSTAHGAQGKTLSSIGSDLGCGGAMAYVIASRARSRDGLALLRPVTLQALNQRPPRDLRIEHQRQMALQHNTLVRHGYTTGSLVEIPEPEAGLNLTDRLGRVRVTYDVEAEQHLQKRKADETACEPAEVPPRKLDLSLRTACCLI